MERDALKIVDEDDRWEGRMCAYIYVEWRKSWGLYRRRSSDVLYELKCTIESLSSSFYSPSFGKASVGVHGRVNDMMTNQETSAFTDRRLRFFGGCGSASTAIPSAGEGSKGAC